jgi:hypothetical protein
MLIKHHEKQLSFYVLNLLADYARTMQHKQILHWGSNREVDDLIFKKQNTRKQRSDPFFSNKVVVLLIKRIC